METDPEKKTRARAGADGPTWTQRHKGHHKLKRERPRVEARLEFARSVAQVRAPGTGRAESGLAEAQCSAPRPCPELTSARSRGAPGVHDGQPPAPARPRCRGAHAGLRRRAPAHARTHRGPHADGPAAPAPGRGAESGRGRGAAKRTGSNRSRRTGSGNERALLLKHHAQPLLPRSSPGHQYFRRTEPRL
jgi:hypothetical protein